MTQSPEERQRQQNAASLRWHQNNRPGTGVIGEVRPLAPGAINPLYAIQDRIWSEDTGLGDIVRKGAEALKLTQPSKKLTKQVSAEGVGRYLTKVIEIDPD